MSITQNGQVVRSPINADFRPTGRSTMGVKFVGPKSGDSVAVVARSVESREDEDAELEGEVDRRRERRRIVRCGRGCNNRGNSGRDGARRRRTRPRHRRGE